MASSQREPRSLQRRSLLVRSLRSMKLMHPLLGGSAFGSYYKAFSRKRQLGESAALGARESMPNVKVRSQPDVRSSR